MTAEMRFLNAWMSAQMDPSQNGTYILQQPAFQRKDSFVRPCLGRMVMTVIDFGNHTAFIQRSC